MHSKAFVVYVCDHVLPSLDKLARPDEHTNVQLDFLKLFAELSEHAGDLDNQEDCVDKVYSRLVVRTGCGAPLDTISFRCKSAKFEETVYLTLKLLFNPYLLEVCQHSSKSFFYEKKWYRIYSGLSEILKNSNPFWMILFDSLFLWVKCVYPGINLRLLLHKSAYCQ